MNAANANSPPPSIEIPPAPRPRPLKLGRALRELRALINAPDDTDHAVTLTYAVGGNDFERNFQRFAKSATSRAMLVERPSLLAALADRAALARLPADSVGRAYLAYLDTNGFQADGLIELNVRVRAAWEHEEGAPPLDALRAWFSDRLTLAHDLFHVMTGYPTDDIGEATLLAFSLAQLGGRGTALLCTGAYIEVARVLGAGWLRYELDAWRRGRRAVWLMALPWEELLPLRLDTVRRLARLDDAGVAHGEGIRRGFVKTRSPEQRAPSRVPTPS